MKHEELRHKIDRHFDEEEIRLACADLGVDYENLPGRTKSGKISSLIKYTQRHGHSPQLIDYLQKKRPHVSWPDKEDEEPKAPDPTTVNFPGNGRTSKGIRIGELSVLGCVVRDLAITLGAIIGIIILVSTFDSISQIWQPKPTPGPSPTPSPTSMPGDSYVSVLPECGVGPDVSFTVRGFNWPTGEPISLYWDGSLEFKIPAGHSGSFNYNWTKQDVSGDENNPVTHIVEARASTVSHSAEFLVPCPSASPN